LRYTFVGAMRIRLLHSDQGRQDRFYCSFYRIRNALSALTVSAQNCVKRRY